jgi:resuscitation-promoting factor RpfE
VRCVFLKVNCAAIGRHSARKSSHLKAGSAAAGAAAISAIALLVGTAHADVNWDAAATCESGGNWAISTGNGFYGGLQFTLAAWRANGGVGMPENSSREQQIAVVLAPANLWQKGWHADCDCFRTSPTAFSPCCSGARLHRSDY